MIKIARVSRRTALALALACSAGPAFAAGGGGGSGSGGGSGGSGNDTTMPNMPACKKGAVYNKTTKKCEETKSGVVDDQNLADYAYVIGKRHKRHAEALEILALVQQPQNPKVLNYKGYFTRKLGNVEAALPYYLESVRLDPDYTLVREYLGEAYVQLGRFDAAREQLNEIKARCGTECEPYEDLAKALRSAGQSL